MNVPTRPVLESLRQSGLTLVELMVAMALSLFVLGAAMALFLSTANHYRDAEDISDVQDSGRLALDLISRIVRQTQYENWDAPNGELINAAAYAAIHGSALTPAIMGANNAGARNDREPTFGEDNSGGLLGSDTLYVRYFGVSDWPNATRADGTVIDCAGNGIAAPSSVDAADIGRGTSIFYVAHDGSGEPTLYCKYRGTNQFAVTPLVRGVESLQILYGLDTGTADSYPDKFVRADEVNSDDEWRQVVALKIALVVRGKGNQRSSRPSHVFHLFGERYDAAKDKGAIIDIRNLPENSRGSFRRLFTTTVFLRNASQAPL